MKRRSLAIMGFGLAVIGGAVAFSVLPSPTEAASSRGPTFVIPANDGYGVAECLNSGSACGQVMADAWCEAQGFRRSASFGPVDVETTGSIEPSRRPISVTCAP
ncbi:hypothetical protein [Enterovirga rhinocerotis]|uniref:Uncharacterized protein n=1 Tax=Enterovirga rhinocerotis TaxID=1339210 RepID=A0A4R7C4X2_9HYPH|nr:hypothetical protein [Enterovirga rhinocerotis]TDR93574.1 hypothetical protein EV668_0839 [Enterovirga rhinocerotis]